MTGPPPYGDFALGLRFALAALFTIAVAGKLTAPTRFIAGLREWGLIPDGFAAFAACTVIALESTTVVLLAKDETVTVGTYVAIGLLATFLIAAVVTLGRRRNVECHCFDVLGSETLGMTSIVRLASCLLVAACAAVIPPGNASREPLLAITVGAGVALLVLHIGAARIAWLGYTAKASPGHGDGGRLSFRLAAGDGGE